MKFVNIHNIFNKPATKEQVIERIKIYDWFLSLKQNERVFGAISGFVGLVRDHYTDLFIYDWDKHFDFAMDFNLKEVYDSDSDQMIMLKQLNEEGIEISFTQFITLFVAEIERQALNLPIGKVKEKWFPWPDRYNQDHQTLMTPLK